MLLHKSIIQAFGTEGISGIYFEVEEPEKQNFEMRLCEIFNQHWEESCVYVKNTYGNCFETENRWPSGIDCCFYDKGILATFSALYIMYDYGTKCDVGAGMQALNKTLDDIRKEYPDIRYYGYIAFLDVDHQVFQEEITSDEKLQGKRYEFIAEAIGVLNEKTEEYLDLLLDCCYEESDAEGEWVLDVVEAFHFYEDKIDLALYDEIMSVTCEYIENDDVYELLEKKIGKWKANY